MRLGCLLTRNNVMKDISKEKHINQQKKKRIKNIRESRFHKSFITTYNRGATEYPFCIHFVPWERH